MFALIHVRYDPVTEDVAPEAKQSRMNWSKGDNRTKLEVPLSKWKEEPLDENGAALSIHDFANIEGIPERSFRRLVTRQPSEQEVHCQG
jgi:hypothetical protein